MKNYNRGAAATSYWRDQADKSEKKFNEKFRKKLNKKPNQPTKREWTTESRLQWINDTKKELSTKSDSELYKLGCKNSAKKNKKYELIIKELENRVEKG